MLIPCVIDSPRDKQWRQRILVVSTSQINTCKTSSPTRSCVSALVQRQYAFVCWLRQPFLPPLPLGEGRGEGPLARTENSLTLTLSQGERGQKVAVKMNLTEY